MRASTCSYKILIAFWGDSEAELDIQKKITVKKER